MATLMSRDAYEKIVAEDLAWLRKQPNTLERRHIEEIVKRSPDHEYEGSVRVKNLLRQVAAARAVLLGARTHEKCGARVCMLCDCLAGLSRIEELEKQFQKLEREIANAEYEQETP